MPRDDYQFNIRMELQRVVYDPSDTEHRYPRFMQTRMEFADTLTLSADSFMECASLLSQFHDLAERIKRERSPIAFYHDSTANRLVAMCWCGHSSLVHALTEPHICEVRTGCECVSFTAAAS
jgi:hypothetical protein